MTVVATNIRDLVSDVRANLTTLRVETNSGSLYYLNPIDDRLWYVRRFGVDGDRSVHDGATVHLRGTELFIGPWRTTGLKRVSVL